MIAMLSMTLTFAESENTEVTTSAYNVNFNYRKVADALDLSSDQMETMQDVNKTFKAEMMNAESASKEDRTDMIAQAIRNNLQYMSYILTPEQFSKYTILFNRTMKNRGLEK